MPSEVYCNGVLILLIFIDVYFESCVIMSIVLQEIK